MTEAQRRTYEAQGANGELSIEAARLGQEGFLMPVADPMRSLGDGSAPVKRPVSGLLLATMSRYHVTTWVCCETAHLSREKMLQGKNAPLPALPS